MAPDPESNRCSHCDVNWPAADGYLTCPTCGRATWRARFEQPVAPTEARDRMQAHKKRTQAREEFEDYYSQREEQQAQEAVEDLLRDLGLAA